MSVHFPSGKLPHPDSPYWIGNPLDIRQQFVRLSKRGERVLLWHGSEDAVVSIVLEVTASGDLLLDVGPDARTNARLLSLPQLVLTAQLDGIALVCAIGPLAQASHDRLPAFACDLPERLHRLQRREFHRMSIPAGHRTHCDIPLGQPEPTRFSLYDISLGGLGLLESPAAAGRLSPGSVWQDCVLVLHDIGAVTADLEVRHTTGHALRSGHVSRKVGCQFLKLSPGAEPSIQRYITLLELDRRALTG